MSARRARADDHGAATVELALVLPVLVAVVALGVFGAWLGLVRVVLEHGAEAGLRTASVPALSDRSSWSDQDAVARAVDEATALVVPTSVEVAGAAVRNGVVEVVVTYAVANPLRLVGGPPTISVVATAVGRRE